MVIVNGSGYIYSRFHVQSYNASRFVKVWQYIVVYFLRRHNYVRVRKSVKFFFPPRCLLSLWKLNDHAVLLYKSFLYNYHNMVFSRLCMSFVKKKTTTTKKQKKRKEIAISVVYQVQGFFVHLAIYFLVLFYAFNFVGDVLGYLFIFYCVVNSF